ncbi:hypothetical protein GALMADRAFT_157644 [Galerina marginata CBS 339.88]|uniref:Uncharacterized protein n=1 Tax=Galerina marginata (strain CBS 339.88) TaxID=685588 RepID=A0A067T3H1_GALM3|nr:hypothetical protein GALMADRAFT_157644 [Galerina marginata CBS 339.88]
MANYHKEVGKAIIAQRGKISGKGSQGSPGPRGEEDERGRRRGGEANEVAKAPEQDSRNDPTRGFADHVPPPTGVPNPDGLTYTEVSLDGKNYTFNFDRLGVRVPTLIISPWVQKGVIEHAGQNQGLSYSHSSIAAFMGKLWNLDGGEPLTKRVGFASTFEHLIMNQFRSDTPVTLPAPATF